MVFLSRFFGTVCGHIDIDCVTTGRSPVFSLEEEAKIYKHVKAVAELGYGYTRGRGQILQLIMLFRHTEIDDQRLLYLNQELSSILEGASAYAVNKNFVELETIMIKYDLQDKPHLIYYIDEKGLMQNHKPQLIVATDHLHPPAVTDSKSAITTVFGAGSASGVAIPPFLYLLEQACCLID
ncbi:LOW QUALITY PROTEIN: hypothetical protein KUTeg_020591 [Tegillarca granosa]|uniref:Uncharacterized protein n=1 Tax=Tegillarca granosa TaxID=220873 RepID=A0ABQ9EAV7_TEGGR|nr:LOW QUALITY PROTEIN: hypothetical protein KUTeg_020591 [Tegillarca granosa]